jgi:alpha-L-fucosidase
VKILANGRELDYTTRCPIIDSLFNPDPLGELTIQVPETFVDPYTTVIAIDLTPKEAEG